MNLIIIKLTLERFLNSQNHEISSAQILKVSVFGEVSRFTPSHLFLLQTKTFLNHIHKTAAAVLFSESCDISIVMINY